MKKNIMIGSGDVIGGDKRRNLVRTEGLATAGTTECTNARAVGCRCDDAVL
jgi:hypothetical protein